MARDTLDLRGVKCPLSWARAKVHLESLAAGEEVDVLLDDAQGVLAPPSCGVPSGTPRRSSLRFPLSLPGSCASLAMITRTDS